MGGAAVLGGLLLVVPASAAEASTPRAAVTSVDVSASAQVLAAASRRSSGDHEATFSFTARTAGGRAAAGEPVTFWVGPMVPESGVAPRHWYRSGTAAARPYIASASAVTNPAGQARLVLRGQPAKSMEMVSVNVGDLEGYSTRDGRGIAQMDAWWTTPTTTPTAPVGDTIDVSPFMSSAPRGRRVTLRGPAGRGLDHAKVLLSASSSSPSSMMMGSGGRPMESSATGHLTYGVMTDRMGPLTVHVLAELPSSTARASGDLTAEVVTAR